MDEQLTCPDCLRTYEGKQAHCCQMKIWIDGNGRRRVTREIHLRHSAEISIPDSAGDGNG